MNNNANPKRVTDDYATSDITAVIEWDYDETYIYKIFAPGGERKALLPAFVFCAQACVTVHLKKQPDKSLNYLDLVYYQTIFNSIG